MRTSQNRDIVNDISHFDLMTRFGHSFSLSFQNVMFANSPKMFLHRFKNRKYNDGAD